MSGYANRVKTLKFPDLSEDWDTDPVWVVIRNPMTMDPEELASAYDGVSLSDEGKATDRKAARAGNHKLIAKLVIAARAYDATHEPTVDPLTGEITGNADQPLLPPTPWAPEVAAKLPSAIQAEIIKMWVESQNPK